MIEIEITQDMKDRVSKYIQKLGAHKNNYRSSPDSMFTGYMGELVFLIAYPEAEHKNTYDYDAVLDGKTIDVKTKKVNSKPQGYWQTSVFTYNTKQKCDYYSFVQVKSDYSVGWVVGTIDKKVFLDNAYLVEKGVLQPNGLIPKQDSYNLTCKDIEELGVDI